MFKTWPKFYFAFFAFFSFICSAAFAQRDIDFHVTNTFLQGKNILKVKRDFNDPYLWVLTDNNQVYRINSETLVVDDYTSKFNAYGNAPMIDIAGNNKDDVFIAQASRLIRLENGVISTITAANGLRGNLNAIGFSSFFWDINIDDIAYKGAPLLVSSDITVDYYYTTTKNFRYSIDYDKVKLQVSSYRNTMMFRNIEDVSWQFQKGCYPVYSYFEIGIYGAYIYLEPQVFGTQLKATYYNNGYDPYFYFNSNFVLWGNQFWATEKGLFQNAWDHSYNPSINGYHHYLENSHINQITSIYGLTSFGLAATRENLLIGTDEGLFISNSKQFPKQTLPKYDFYHFDGLGLKKINYIEVNAKPTGIQSTLANYCEDGVWVACNDGLYLLKPDYSNYFNETIDVIRFDGVNLNEKSLELCPGTTTTANLNINTNASVQWYKNGQELPNESNPSLKINSAGDYSAVLYDPCSNLHAQTNHLKVTYLTGTSVTLNYPDKMKFCYGSTATLSVPNNPDFQYRWYKDGVLNGVNAPSINITENGKYKLEVNTCAGNWVPTKEVQIDFIHITKPIITAPESIICKDGEVTLSSSVQLDATGVSNWQPYTYKWYRDGVLLPDVTSAIKASKAGDYKVKVTSCAGNTNTSDNFNLKIVELPVPVITSDKNGYCIGDNAQLSVGVPLDPAYTINWYQNGNIVSNWQNQTSVQTNTGGSYQVKIISNSPVCEQASLNKDIQFADKPVVKIEKIIKTTLCEGETVDLKINQIDGSVKWSTGQTSPVIFVNHSGTYRVEYITTGGCKAEDQIDLILYPKPVLNLFDQAICAFKKETLTLTAPAGYKTYSWNHGESTSATFNVTKPQTVTLEVTDINNCTAIQDIQIRNQCPDIRLANTFTPNGDGINDTWSIAGVENDPTVVVRVFNRAGIQVFESKGYQNAWDGTYNGKRLSAGVYYYVITTKASSEILKGALTILY